MLVVPGHCLAQAAREFLALYPNARILVADETNFTKDKRTASCRARRPRPGTRSSSRIRPSVHRRPSAFEQQMIQDELELYETLLTKVEGEDRVSRKRLERLKEGLQGAAGSALDPQGRSADHLRDRRRPDHRRRGAGVPQALLRHQHVDAQGRRSERLAARLGPLCEVPLHRDEEPGRALVLASGTPITNTLGEMFTVQRLMDHAALSSAACTSSTPGPRPSATHDRARAAAQRQIQAGHALRQLRQRARADRHVPLLRGRRDAGGPARNCEGAGDLDRQAPDHHVEADGRLQALPDAARRAHQGDRAARGPPEPGDDILLSVITDGRHAAIDLRLVDPDNDNEPDNKLNDLVAMPSASGRRRPRTPMSAPTASPSSSRRRADDLLRSRHDQCREERGFSAYRWIRDELVRMGVPASEIAFMQDFKKSEAKQRLFGDVRAGKVRFLIGSSETMGTGVNAQLRLKALHHLDVPWLPSQIEQREGRIVRQGNQHDEVDIFAYATEGSLDATMWQNNERKARFIAAALSGDTSIRRLEDLGEGQANQFAMAKAIASGDPAPDAEGGARSRHRPARTAARRASGRPVRHPPPDPRCRARYRLFDPAHRRDRRGHRAPRADRRRGLRHDRRTRPSPSASPPAAR
jgi:hypothetical protein